MKRKILFFIATILLSSSTMLFANERNFDKGYYLTLTGDTIKGLIRLETKKRGTDTYIAFKTSHGEKARSVDPEESKGFYLIEEARTFVSAKFSSQMGGWQFLEKVDDGYYTIYLTDLNVDGFTIANTVKLVKTQTGHNKYDHYTYDVPLMAVQNKEGVMTVFSSDWKAQLLDLLKDNKELYDEAYKWESVDVSVLGAESKSKYREHDYYKMHSILVRYNLWKAEH